MTAIDRGTCWAPVPLRWRHVRPGDVTVAEDGSLIPIVAVLLVKAGVRITYLLDGRDHFTTEDPDEMVEVLVSIKERDLMAATAEQLSTWVIDRATDGRGVA